MLLYIVIALVLLVILLFAMGKQATKQKVQEEQKRQALFATFGFEAKEEFRGEVQDVLELLESHYSSRSVEITHLYQDRTNPNRQLAFININDTNEGEDELILIARGTKHYPESLIVSTPAMEGIVGKVIGFVLEKIQAPHLKAVEITNPILVSHYKIASDDPHNLRQKLSNATLEELLKLGNFTLHLKGNLMVVSLFHFHGAKSTEEDIGCLMDIAKALQN